MNECQMKIRLPAEVRDWLANEVRENASSLSSEVVRSVRERMKREQARFCTEAVATSTEMASAS